MANSIKQLRELIAVSLFTVPCTEEELNERDFLKTTSHYGVGMQLQKLDQLGATWYDKDDKIHIYKKWAKVNLKEYDLGI